MTEPIDDKATCPLCGHYDNVKFQARVMSLWFICARCGWEWQRLSTTQTQIIMRDGSLG